MFIVSQDGDFRINTQNIKAIDVGIGPIIRVFEQEDKSGLYTSIARYNDYDVANFVLNDLENHLTDNPNYFYKMPYGNEQWIINAMSSHKAEWISVEDRLPEVGEQCLIYCNKSKKIYEVYADHIDNSNDVKRLVVYAVKAPDDEFTDVYYWMPLPEPPKED